MNKLFALDTPLLCLEAASSSTELAMTMRLLFDPFLEDFNLWVTRWQAAKLSVKVGSVWVLDEASRLE
eukprot:5303498-Ditylum_brightwellii.AAC.1